MLKRLRRRWPTDFNPIWRREWRQWTRGRAFWLVPFFLSAALAFVAYQRAVQLEAPLQPNEWPLIHGPSQLSLWGLIFVALAFLLSPALSAPAIASEREAGLLESLQLSPLRPLQIAMGKWAASSSRALWLWLASLPIQSTALWFGGITIFDCLRVWLVQIVAIAFACAFGIWCSAWSRRAPNAMRAAYGFGLLWQIVTINALSIGTTGRMFPVAIWMQPAAWMQKIYLGLAACNPLIACALSWWPPLRNWARAGDGDWLLGLPLLTLSVLWQIVATIGLLLLCVPALRRPFADAPFIEKKTKKPAASTCSAEDDAKTDGWWEIPIGRWLRFANPLWQREFIAKFRMRQVPLGVIIFEAILGAVVLLFYLRTFWMALVDPSSRALTWWALALIGLLVVMTAMLIMGASAFSREYETGTWTFLRLSELSARDIISGKLGAMLIACAAFSLPFWPLLLLCVRDWQRSPRGVGWNEMFAVTCVVLATAFGYGAFGMLLSHFFRKTSSATLCALAALFGCDVLVPLLASGPLNAPALLAGNRFFNPVLVLLEMMTATNEHVWTRALPVSCTLAFIGTLALFVLHRQLQDAK